MHEKSCWNPKRIVKIISTDGLLKWNSVIQKPATCTFKMENTEGDVSLKTTKEVDSKAHLSLRISITFAYPQYPT